MDDGSKQGGGFYLNTQSFSKGENLFLIKILMDKFKLECTLNNTKGKYIIYIRKQSINLFKELVKPYFHESMLYKLK
jgi:anti-sigma regulatory factor (Ser/Thr protein kinase)